MHNAVCDHPFFLPNVSYIEMPCIDVHHHFFPPDLQKAKAAANTPLGWRTPLGHLQWSPELSLKAMDELGVDISILSLPAISHGTVGEENRKVTRDRNKFVHKVCGQHPTRFGFFASLPFLDDVEGCLNEIQFALDDLHADGISLASSYGEGSSAKYIGDALYEPIWRELDARGAVVFLHGSQTPSSTPYPHPFLGVPITEVPNETYKAAAHLVVTGRRRLFPNAKIILAHLGGTLPCMAARTAALAHYMGCSLTPEEILEDFKSFYFETALSAYGPALRAVEEFAGHGRMVFGSDFPAVSTETVAWFNDQLEQHYDTKIVGGGKEQMEDVLYRNALLLFPNKAKMLGVGNSRGA